MVRHEPVNCPGPMGRRSFLRAGILGLAGMSAGNVRLGEAFAAQEDAASNTACIFAYLHGGPSHLETYDLKPEAPEEFRGIFQPIATNVAGITTLDGKPGRDHWPSAMSILISGGGMRMGQVIGSLPSAKFPATVRCVRAT